MDEKQVALEQIKSIHEVFHSGDRIAGSPRGLYVSGASALLVAIIMAIVKLQDMGWVGIRLGGPLIILALVAATALNLRSRQSPEELELMKARSASLHPLLKQSFRTARALLVAGFGLSIVWWLHLDRMMALWMVLLGVITHLWGRLIHESVEKFSYVLTLGGVIVAGLSEFNISENVVVMIALAYMGIWSMVAGRLVQKYQRS